MRDESFACLSLGPSVPGLRRMLLLAMLWGFSSAPAFAQCDSAPIAVDDLASHEGRLMVIDVLANDAEPDGEALTLVDVDTDCDGIASHDFGLVSLQPAEPRSQACWIDYVVEDEQGSQATARIEIVDTGVIFRDGFESGDISAWSEEDD